MIRIIFDPTDLSANKNKSIRNISEYPLSIKDSIYSLSEGRDLTIFIIQPVMLQWFKNMATRYPQGTFVFETIGARGALAQRWGIDIPATITNEDILQSGLLSRDLQPQQGFSFVDTLLAHYYAPIMTSKTFPFTQLATLLDAVKPEQWKENVAVPLLARTLHTRLEEWKSKARTSDQRQLIELFDTDPARLKQLLMSFRVIHRYPTIAEALLEDTYPLLSTLKLQLQDLEVEESKIPDTVLQVTYHLNKQQPQDREDLAALLEGMSGLLSIEFDNIEKHLLRHPDWITLNLMEQVENKFSSQSRRVAHRIAVLRGLIRPPKPGYPELSWNVDTMLSWATESYLPYQACCNTQERFDLELFNISDRFSQCLLKFAEHFTPNSNTMVCNILT